ncbi:MAG TPA: hypothetical protein VM451_09540 [Candidatus Limnocylindria bacterium]|nr:hypothetical protein [Candidatus Limnocylindria bacterium]
MTGYGWACRVEVSYNVYGERGSIDILAWHAPTRTLLVVEVKTEIASVEETLRKHDAKVRLAPRLAAAELGWQALCTARLLVLPSHSTARRRVDRHRNVFAITYPLGGADVRSWLAQPSLVGSASETSPRGGLLFIDPGRNEGAAGTLSRRRIRTRAGTKRVR